MTVAGPVDIIARAVAGGFEVASALRGTKAFHPKGHVHEATATIRDNGALLAPPGTHDALVRLSRGVGLPEGVPDILGVAIRILDAHGAGRHQDLLLASSRDLPVLRHMLIPVLDFDGHDYTSSLPYSTPGGLVVLGAHLQGSRVELWMAPLTGRSTRIGEVLIGTEEHSGPEPRFDPGNSGPDLRPAGVLNRVREDAYEGSQSGWRRRGEQLRT